MKQKRNDFQDGKRKKKIRREKREMQQSRAADLQLGILGAPHSFPCWAECSAPLARGPWRGVGHSALWLSSVPLSPSSLFAESEFAASLTWTRSRQYTHTPIDRHTHIHKNNVSALTAGSLSDPISQFFFHCCLHFTPSFLYPHLTYTNTYTHTM